MDMYLMEGVQLTGPWRRSPNAAQIVPQRQHGHHCQVSSDLSWFISLAYCKFHHHVAKNSLKFIYLALALYHKPKRTKLGRDFTFKCLLEPSRGMNEVSL